MNKKLVLIVSLAVAFTLSLAVAFTAVGLTRAAAEGDDGFSPVNIEEVYKRGDLMGVPEVTYFKSGSTHKTSAVLHYPDGTAKSVSGNVLLTQFGQYTIEYSAAVGGTVYSTKKDFYAYLSKFELSSPDDDVYYEENGVEGSQGEMVTLSAEQSLTINDYFDLSTASLAKPIFECVIVPSSQGTADFDTLQIDFICKNDPSQYLRVIANYNSSNNCTYFLAGVHNQTPSGYESYWQKLHIGDNWGAPWYGTFAGRTQTGYSQVSSDIKVWLDYATKKVYGNIAKGFVVDLDDSQYFGNLWTGFENNEVYLRVSASRYKSTTPAKFLILRAGDIDLSAQEVFDTAAPEITVDYAGLDEDNLPVGIVGQKYKIFDATAEDYLSGACKVKTSVSAYLNTSGEHEVEISDGYFTPASAGVHAITYTAKDASGNVATKTVTINVENSHAAPDMNLSGATTSARTGEFVRIADGEPINCIGKATVKSRVTFGGNDVEVVSGAFLAEKAGAYTVTLTVTDYLDRTTEKSYVVNVTTNDKAVFIDDIHLPRYLIAGSTYTFDDVYAYDYTSGGNGKKVKATLVTEDKNGTKEHADGKYAPQVANHLDAAKVYFKATVNGVAAVSRKFDLPVCVVGDGKNIDISKYFISDDATIEKSNAGMVITTSTDKAKVEFANYLLANGASIEFDVDATKNNFGRVNVYLTDVFDESQTVAISYEKSSEARSFFYVSGGTKYEIPASFYGKGLNSFTYKYDNDQLSVTDGSSVTFGVKKTVYGEDFKGFSSGIVRFTLEFDGVKGSSSIILSKLSGQNTTSVKADIIKPRISLDNLMAFRYNLNDVIELTTAVALDVLDPNIESYYTVTGVGGEIVKDVNGEELSRVPLTESRKVVLDKYGTYRVTFTAIDWNGKKEIDFGYIMEVVDVTAPVITLLNEPATTAKAGDRMAIPRASATDELDGELEIYVFVLLPDGTFAKYGTTVTEYEVKGTYTFYLYAFDTSGNTAVKTYEVTVA